MAPSATNISISPVLEPKQQNPNSNPERIALSTALPEILLERRELVEACHDRDCASCR
jgi:hypothetical protein